MKKATKLTKSVHPILGKIVLGAGILLATIALVLVLQYLSVSPTLTKQKPAPPPTTTPVPTFNPAYFALTPTPTLAPGQKAIYTFYIQTTSDKTKSKGLDLKQADAGKVFTVDIGTLIIIDFGVPNFHIAHSSPQNIFEGVGSIMQPAHLPADAIGGFRVTRAGFGTITVIETE